MIELAMEGVVYYWLESPYDQISIHNQLSIDD